MITSQIEEPLVVHGIYDEYLNKVFKYQNCLRTSIFMRYLNINKSVSEHHDITDATFDKFKSGIYYDTYDYTPGYLVNSITNASTNRDDLAGYIFDGSLSIVTYSITEPNINDLVIFPYKPHESEHIFRVKTISTTIKNKIYQLELEYAPIRDLTTLNYLNNYVYITTKETNILSSDYVLLMTTYNQIQQDLGYLQLFFDKRSELYYYIFNGSNIAPININAEINSYMSSELNNNRYVDNYIKPYGVYNLPLDRADNLAINLSDKKLPFIILNNDNLPKMNSILEFKPPYDADIDYLQFTIDPVLFNLPSKFKVLYEI